MTIPEGGTPTNLGDYSALGNYTNQPYDQLSVSHGKQRSRYATSISKMVKKQHNYSSSKNPKTAACKKTTRLFNVSNQPSSAFIKASDVLLNPFTLSERKTDLASER